MLGWDKVQHMTPDFDILKNDSSGGFSLWTHGPFTSHHDSFRSERSRGENMIHSEKLRFPEKSVLRPSAGVNLGSRRPDFFADAES